MESLFERLSRYSDRGSEEQKKIVTGKGLWRKSGERQVPSPKSPLLVEPHRKQSLQQQMIMRFRKCLPGEICLNLGVQGFYWAQAYRHLVLGMGQNSGFPKRKLVFITRNTICINNFGTMSPSFCYQMVRKLQGPYGSQGQTSQTHKGWWFQAWYTRVNILTLLHIPFNGELATYFLKIHGSKKNHKGRNSLYWVIM